MSRLYDMNATEKEKYAAQGKAAEIQGAMRGAARQGFGLANMLNARENVLKDLSGASMQDATLMVQDMAQRGRIGGPNGLLSEQEVNDIMATKAQQETEMANQERLMMEQQAATGAVSNTAREIPQGGSAFGGI